MFQTNYLPISTEHPEWGNVAVLPWDTDIFGFPVGDYKVGDALAVAANRDAFHAALQKWAETNRVELVSASVPVADPLWCSLLQDNGFRFVDCTLEVIHKHVQTVHVPATRNPLRVATPQDQEQVEQLAENAFRYGRYHADTRFPRALADLRYRRWLRNAFASMGPQSIVYVAGPPEHIRGFIHLNFNGTDSYMTIAAVENSLQGSVVGFDLIAETVNKIKALGVRRNFSKISAGNLGIVNIALSFDCRFGPPQAVFHWHAPHAPHLLPRDAAYQSPAPVV